MNHWPVKLNRISSVNFTQQDRESVATIRRTIGNKSVTIPSAFKDVKNSFPPTAFNCGQPTANNDNDTFLVEEYLDDEIAPDGTGDELDTELFKFHSV